MFLVNMLDTANLSRPQAPQQPLTQLPTKGGWHRHLAKPLTCFLPSIQHHLRKQCWKGLCRWSYAK